MPFLNLEAKFGRTFLGSAAKRHVAENMQHLHVKGEYKHKLRDNDCASLEVDRLPAVVAQVLDLEHRRIGIPGELRECPFEVGEKGRIVQCPFRGFLWREFSLSCSELCLAQRYVLRNTTCPEVMSV